MRRPIRMALVAVPLVACVTPAAIPTERVVPGPTSAVAARIEAALSTLGLRRTQASTVAIEGETRLASADWASCPPALVSDGDDRRRMVGAEQRRARVHVDLAPAGAAGPQSETVVRVTATFAAGYRNPFTGYGLERECRSRGVVERALLDAAAS